MLELGLRQMQAARSPLTPVSPGSDLNLVIRTDCVCSVKCAEATWNYKSGRRNNNMETCIAQESVKQPLTALQTGEQRNMKSQCNTKNKDKTNKIPYYTKIHYKSLTKALVKR